MRRQKSCDTRFRTYTSTLRYPLCRFNKVDKTIAHLRELQNILPRSALLIVYKTSIRPHLDYGDSIHHQLYNLPFHQKLELL